MIIPNVFREDYILALRAFSGGDPVPAVRMFVKAMDITTSIPFEMGFEDLSSWLKDRNAYEDPAAGRWIPSGTPQPARLRMR